MFRSATIEEKTDGNKGILLPAQYVCPKCKKEGTLTADVFFRHQLPMVPQASLQVPTNVPAEAIIEKLNCASCDFSLELVVIHVATLRQPTCDDCKLRHDCISAGAPRYAISAHLCPDFRWRTSSEGFSL